jgi:hypothetical protein
MLTWGLPHNQQLGPCQYHSASAEKDFRAPLLLASRDWPTAHIVSANHRARCPARLQYKYGRFSPQNSSDK